MSDSQAIERRNFLLNLGEGALFSAAGAFMSPHTVLPVIVATLGGNNIAVGAIGVIVWVGLFLPQIFAARYVEALPWKKPWAIKFGALQRITVLCMAVSLLLFGQDRPAVALVLFFASYTLCQVMLGITTPGWFDMFAKMTPTRKRGRLVGIRSSLAGAGAFCCGLVLTWLLANLSFPHNFGFALLIAFALQAASVVVQSLLIETEPSPTLPRRPLFPYLRELPAVVRENKAFRNFFLAAMCQILASMPAGFYTVYAMGRFQLSEAAVGTFTLAIVGVQVVSSIGIGFLADRQGNKIVLVLAAAALLCANVLALASPSVGWFLVVYLFLGVNLGTELLARYNIAVEFASLEKRSTYVGLMNTILAPLYLVGLLGGTISELFGYMTVFWIGTGASIAGVLLMLFLVEDPRHTVKAVAAET